MKKVKCLKTMTIQLRNESWKLKFYDDENFNQLGKIDESLGKADVYCGADAITQASDRIIDFRVKAVNIKTVRHELGHAYVATLHLQDADLTAAQMEEVFCNLLARRDMVERVIYDTSDRIIEKFEKWQNEKAKPKPRREKRAKEGKADLRTSSPQRHDGVGVEVNVLQSIPESPNGI